GTFDMGSEEGRDNEKPVHKVNLSDFYMCKYQLSQKEWQFVMGNNPSYFKGEDLPVENVSWNGVQEFIQKLNALMKAHGHKATYCLPSEAQWEYAARGGQNFKYAGSDNLDEVAWYGYEKAGKTTHPVGQKKANGYGLYDMSGNVWEWCQDYYDANFYKNNKSINNPINETNEEFVVVRGGSWFNDVNDCRSTNRDWYRTDDNGSNIGCRLVLFPL
ncbi:MAG: formylglycine-generating enzyme family protein, partial [Bacteroidia bacterium]